MRQTTSIKLLTCLFITFFLPFLVGGSLAYWYEKKECHQELVQNLHHNTKILAETLAEPVAFFSPQEGLRVAQMIALNENVVEISVYSEIYQMSLVHIDIPERRQGELLSHEQTVSLDGEVVGRVRMTVTANTIIKDIFSPFLKKILVIFLGMSVLGFLSMGVAFRKYLVLPMGKLLIQAGKIGQGNMEDSFIWQGNDDFAILGKTIEAMREKLFLRFRKIHLEARTDELTGISNRRDFLEKVELALALSRKQNQPFSLIMFDLDNFKSINDGYGHAVGDQVLHIVSFSMKQNLRQGDLFARWGGEEFLLALPGTSQTQACQLAEKLRQVISISNYPEKIHVTASFGVVEAKDGQLFQTLVDEVDEAMYMAKKQGKDRVVAYQPGNAS